MSGFFTELDEAERYARYRPYFHSVAVERARKTCGLCWIYTNGFTGAMREDPAFERWNHEVYPGRFPTPLRDKRPFAAEDAAAAGFLWIGAALCAAVCCHAAWVPAALLH